MTGSEMDRFLGTGKCSVHEVGLLDLMDIARLTDNFPAHRALIGIQPETTAWGDVPSAPVWRAFPEVAVHALGLIEQWAGKTG
jgi:hydrogenase maturation protease